jgi:hypothetical protein
MVLAISDASQAAPGVLGFLVVAGMGLILYFLFRSMAKHLRKVSAPRPGTVEASSQPAGTASAASQAAGSQAAGTVGASSRAAGSVATGNAISDDLANRGTQEPGADS